MTPTPDLNRPVAGLLWMLGTTFSFAGVNVIVHHVGTAVPAQQGAFLRFLWSAIFMAPALLALFRANYPRKVWLMFTARGALHAVAVTLWFYAMARTPIADVTAIGYLNPIVVTLGGALLLGEGLAWRRAIAIVIAIFGALVILRPGIREVLPGHIAQLGAAFFFGAAYLVAKRLTGHVSAGAVVAAMTLFVTVLLAPLAAMVWQPVSLVDLLWLGLTALFATSAHYCMTRAFQCAPVTVTQPVMFLQLVWAAAAGWLLFGETIDPYVFLGAGLIIGAISYMSWREAVLKRRATPLVGETKA